ncbi:MAG: hypothetical protein JST19_13670 [Bacteroidetes bacterium]|nr:hypothetical protein [Bacteroidota bacterium]
MKKLLNTILLLAALCGTVLGQDMRKLQLSAGYTHGIVSNFTGDSYRETSSLGGSIFSDTSGKNRSHQLNGFDVSGAYQLSDHFAAKASFGWLTGSATTDIPGGSFGRGSAAQPTFVLVVPGYSGQHTAQSYYSVSAGVEYKDFKSPHKLKPFGQLMIGLGFENASSNLTSSTHAIIYQTQNLKVNTTAFSIDAGAGLDIKLTKNFDLRIIQVDFVPTFSFKTDIQKTGDLRGPFPFTSFPNDRLYTLQTVTTNNGFQANFRFGAGIVFTPDL